MTDPRTGVVERGYDAVTGVDISEERISRARANVPDADFIQDELAPMQEPEGEVAFHWVLARR